MSSSLNCGAVPRAHSIRASENLGDSREQLPSQTSNNALESHRRRTLAHASLALDFSSSVTRQDACSRVKSFLKKEEARLRIAFRLGLPGRSTTACRGSVVDLTIERVLHWASTLETQRPCEIALIALGGYGRYELAPYSDIDILVLHRHRQTSDYTNALVIELQHLLWDSGLDLAQRSHSLDDCLSAIRDNHHVQTALATNHFVAGSRALFQDFLQELSGARKKHAAAWLRAIQSEREARLRKYSAAVCTQEPNIKESAGGLRDLHTIFWTAYAGNGSCNLEALQEAAVISDAQYHRLDRAYDFLLRVRNEAHWLTRRKTDQLTLDLQPLLAARLGYEKSPHLRASEQFMRDYYRRANEIDQAAKSFLQQALETRAPTRRWLRPFRGKTGSAGFSISEGQLHFRQSGEEHFLDPMLFLHAFDTAQKEGVGLASSLRELLQRRLDVIDGRFRASKEAGEWFLKILSRSGRVGCAVRLMQETGFLERYLPEFSRITFLIQHDLYHHYTVDEHTIRALEALDNLPEIPCGAKAQLRTVRDELEDPAVLYLSLLLHDIGKGRGPGHALHGVTLAERISGRLKLDPARKSQVLKLIRLHLLMSHLSQRRDLSEPHVAAELAREMETINMLNMLFLLTYADLSAVAPGVWNGWKGSLLSELYQRTRSVLSRNGVSDETGRLAVIRDEVKSLVSTDSSVVDVDRHFTLLPERYALVNGPHAILEHLKALKRFEDNVIGCHWSRITEGVTRLTICAHDRHGLFAALAGTLAGNGADILSADINTREDGIVVDSFMLQDSATRHTIDERRMFQLERALTLAVAGKVDVAAQVGLWRKNSAPKSKKISRDDSLALLPQIRCDNQSVEAATIVEVRALDEHGLAYKIAAALSSAGVEINRARISTDKQEAFDVFYVTDASGSKLSENDIEEVKRALQQDLEGFMRVGGPD